MRRPRSDRSVALFSSLSVPAAVTLTVPDATVLRQALTYRDETFERSLGRAVRRNGGTYADYVAIMSKLREAARTQPGTIREAARRLAGQP